MLKSLVTIFLSLFAVAQAQQIYERKSNLVENQNAISNGDLIFPSDLKPNQVQCNPDQWQLLIDTVEKAPGTKHDHAQGLRRFLNLACPTDMEGRHIILRKIHRYEHTCGWLCILFYMFVAFFGVIILTIIMCLVIVCIDKKDNDDRQKANNPEGEDEAAAESGEEAGAAV